MQWKLYAKLTKMVNVVKTVKITIRSRCVTLEVIVLRCGRVDEKRLDRH